MAELTVADMETWQDQHSQQSLDTDDEADGEMMASMGRKGLQSLQQYSSIDEADTPTATDDGVENPLLAKSYAKLERGLTTSSGASPGLGAGTGSVGGAASPPGPGSVDLSRDKWHDWFKMQKEWMSKVEEDPDNYFDDCL